MRVEGWEQIAIDYIQQSLNTKFEWGQKDCVLFACDLAKAITGKDPAEKIRGKYNSKKTALSLIKKEPVAPEIVMNDYFEIIHIGFAQRADIVFRRNEDGGFNFGLVWDGKAVFMAENQGIVFEKLEGLTVWRVE
jgi:hypothetical protein